MRLIDLSPITTTAGMAVKSGVLTHFQGAYVQMLNALAMNIVGNNYEPDTIYVLVGCVNSGTDPAFISSVGFVFLNGEIYEVDPTSFVLSGGESAIANIVTTFATGPTGDPVPFTDGSTHNVLQIRKIVISAGTSSGNVADFSNWIRCSSPSVFNKLVSTFGAGYEVDFRQDQAIFFTTGPAAGSSAVAFDFTGAIPGTVVRLKLVSAGGSTVNVDTPAGSNIYNLGGAITPSNTNFVTFEYVGINESGNHEVTYSIISL